jgi:uncharacterized protein (TIGR02453 family)
MIQASTLKFLSDLAQNNHKIWLDEHRPSYENAKQDFEQFTQKLIDGLADLDENMARANLEAKKCISRLHRDVRFSHDKTPYKTNFFAIINQGGKKSNMAGYYVQIQPGNAFVGGGVYMPLPPDLKKFRQEIDYNYPAWQNLVESEAFLKVFEKGIQAPSILKRPPMGFEADNPALDYLKMKGYFTTKALSDELLMSENAIESILQKLKTAKPLVDFLNQAFII